MKIVSFVSTMANPITLLFLFFFVFFIFIGSYVFSKDTKSTENKFFLILCISFSFVCFGEIFFSWSTSKEDAYFFHAVSSIGFFTFWPIVLNFFILFRNKKNWKFWLVFLIISYTISAAYIYMVFAGINASKDYIRDTYTWVDVVTDSFWYSKVYLPFVFVPWVILVFYTIIKIRNTAKRTNDYIKHKQFTIILFSGIIMFVYGVLFSIVFPLFNIKVPAVGHFSTGFWIIAVGYAITKYKFLVPTLEYASKEIFKIGGEMMVVTDMNFSIMEVNDAFIKKLGYTKEQIKNLALSNVFDKEVSIFFDYAEQKEIYNRELLLKKKDNTEIYVNVKTSFIYNNNIKIGMLFVLADITALKNQNEILEQKVQERTSELQEEQIEAERLMNIFSDGSEGKSIDLKCHVKKVVGFSELIAKELYPETLPFISFAASMHDVGKMFVSENILNKEGRLTEEEILIMRKHTEYAYDILKNFKKQKFKAAALVAWQHHERWDGTGYPLGIKGEEISVYARIVSISDVLDALLSKRVYKTAFKPNDARSIIINESGKSFDPNIVNFVVNNFDLFMEIFNKYKEE